jgi:hypothetical protein
MALSPPSTPYIPWLVGQEWEKLGLLLPRSFLNWAEIHFTPKLVSDSEIKFCLDFWRSRRVALVKQTAYRGAYLAGVGHNWMETVMTASAHLGPMSLLADLKADYFVVRQAPDSETNLWKEKMAYDPDPVTSCSHHMQEIKDLENSPSGRNLPSVDDIPWHQYDLVIGLDIPIPTRIVCQSKKTIWAYYSVEAGGPLHKKSLLQPVSGYHLYLNHCFRRYRSRPLNRRHVLEFPFTFQSSKAWQNLAHHTLPSVANRLGAVVDHATWKSHVGEKPNFMTPLSGDSASYIRLMSSSQFAIRTETKTRWGNWALEAIQAGCLFLGRADSLAMPGVLLPMLIVPDLSSAQKALKTLRNNPPQMHSLARTQAALAEHLAFRRPLMDLTNRARAFFNT